MILRSAPGKSGDTISEVGFGFGKHQSSLPEVSDAKDPSLRV